MNWAATAALSMVLLIGLSWLIGAACGALIALVSTAASKLNRFWNGDTLGPARRGASELNEADAPELLAAVRELARRAKIPTPRVYLIKSPLVNALATGRSPRHTAICLTSGLLQAFTRDEVNGVVAHELGHVVHRYPVVATTVAVVAAAIALLAPLAAFFRLGIVGGLVMLIVTPLAAAVVQLAILRACEYDADNFGARLCGRPSVIASGLAKLSPSALTPLAAVTDGHVAKILTALGAHLWGHKTDNLFASHPRIENRIAALEALSRKMGLGGFAASTGISPD
jgi:heat shock protein HtpX